MQQFLQITELNASGRDPVIFAAPLIRQTDQFFVTAESFVHGVIGFTVVERRNKHVYWSKLTERRKSEQVCTYSRSFKVMKVVNEDEIAPGAIRI
jgi:hypothetical protein